MKRLKPITAILVICALIVAVLPQAASAQSSGAVDQYHRGGQQGGGGGGGAAAEPGTGGGVLPFTGFLPTTLLAIGVAAFGSGYVLRIVTVRAGTRAGDGATSG